MALPEDGKVTVDVAGEQVIFPRYLHRPGGKMSEEQRALEAAAFSQMDRLHGNRAPGPRVPGDDDDGVAPPPDTRTPQQREQDVDFEALAVQAIARREAERRR